MSKTFADTNGCADSQSVKVGSLHNNGFDGAKSVNDRKKYLLIDTLGLMLGVLVTSANVPEPRGLSPLLNRSRPHLPRFHHLWLDRGYKGVNFTNRMLLCFGIVLEIVSRRTDKSFSLQARRWWSKEPLPGWAITAGSVKVIKPRPPQAKPLSTSRVVTSLPSVLPKPTTPWRYR